MIVANRRDITDEEKIFAAFRNEVDDEASTNEDFATCSFGLIPLSEDEDDASSDAPGKAGESPFFTVGFAARFCLFTILSIRVDTGDLSSG